MSIVLFVVLLLAAAAVILYPLFRPAPPAGADEITQGVGELRRIICPACGHLCQAGDRFCVRCGKMLPSQTQAGQTCPACGANLPAGDLFCARCGHALAEEERG